MGYKASLNSKMENTAFMHLKFNFIFVFFKLACITNKKRGIVHINVKKIIF